MMKEITAKEYKEAMKIVREYEKNLKEPDGDFTGICRCKKCKLKFAWNRDSIKRDEARCGTCYLYGFCPYCDEEILLTTY